ncbi:hypothetical protein [Rhodanobacter koreensis]
MKRSLSILYLSLSALAGFLAFSAIPLYSIGMLVCLALAWFAYKQIIIKKNRVILIVVSSVDIVIGFFVGRFFPDPLGVSGTGLTILFTVWIINACLVMQMYKNEARKDKD